MSTDSDSTRKKAATNNTNGAQTNAQALDFPIPLLLDESFVSPFVLFVLFVAAIVFQCLNRSYNTGLAGCF
jgi:hypothetical protein